MTAPTADPVARVLAKLGPVRRNGAGWIARCPVHDDKVPSLKVDAGDDGRALIYCHAGCSAADIAAALDLPMSDLFAEPNDTPARETVYAYRDEAGDHLYDVVRTDPGKRFAQRRADGEWSMTGVRRVLYRLPELIAADPAETVYIVEGEKDADRLASLGLIATTASGGAGKWRAEYAEPLHGRRVVILADNDDPGRAHARDVAASTGGTIVELPGLPPKGDVSDWLDAGGTVDDLRRLAAESARPGMVTLSGVSPKRVEWLWPGRLALGKVTILDGDPGLGKSTVALDIAARGSRGDVTPTGEPLPVFDTLLVTNEDDPADTIRPRLDVARGDPRRVHVIAKLTLPDEAERLEAAITATNARLVVVDPLVGFLSDRVRTNSDHEVRRALEPLATLAAKHGVAILGIRHLNKQSGADAIYRGGGSIAFAGLARETLAIGRDPEDEDRCVLAVVKLNLAAKARAVAYRIVSTGPYDPSWVEWEGETEINAESLIGKDRDVASDAGKAAALGRIVRDLVEANGGEMLAKDGYRALEADGIGTDSDADKMALSRARKKAGVRTARQDDDPLGPWVWRLDPAR